ncbi:M23 family metallopeptidase [Nocardia takedensis]
MPVTVPLPTRRPGASRPRRHRVATRAVAVTAVVGASLGVLTAAELRDAGPALAGAVAGPDTETLVAAAAANFHSVTPAPPVPPAPASPDTFTAFTPPEAQRPQTVPEPVLWELHQQAVEAARPRTVRPVAGILTSNFGMRWGEMHKGIDFGEPIGAPIGAVTDGVVIEAGPASGFGLWVRVQQDDGTVGVYGHVNEILATVGQQVKAGEVIATVGNRGYSTGPHLHYEVHDPAAGAIDPLGWLAARGLQILGFPG